VSVLQSSEFGQPIILHLLWEATANESKPLLTLTICRLAFAGAGWSGRADCVSVPFRASSAVRRSPSR
jgi:hypothetical protein